MLPIALGLMGAGVARAEAIPVTLEQTEEGWRLLRGGAPFRIQGAGGNGSLALLKAAGANATRTWGAEDIDGLLDEAHALGLAVVVGIWLGHERHGFDYNDADQVAEQYARVKALVLRYRDHPAVLLWGIGNEMEGFEAGDDAAIWSAVNNLAAMVKKLDPHHPTMTVTAEIGGERVKNVHRLCPDIDILGVNAYGGITSLPERYRAAGGTKPYLVTETGPAGAWEGAKTAWGAPIEPTSTQKAKAYRRAHEAIAKDQELALGTLVFLWSHKREATATWFGMFTPDGQRTAAVDVMTKLWSGSEVADRVPEIVKVGIEGPAQVPPGTEVRAYVLARDPENEKLSYRWWLEPEEREIMTGGDAQPEPTPMPDAVSGAQGEKPKVRLPERPGGYRLYVMVTDPKQGAAVANIPLRVLGEVETSRRPALELPIVVYAEAGGQSP